MNKNAFVSVSNGTFRYQTGRGGFGKISHSRSLSYGFVVYVTTPAPASQSYCAVCVKITSSLADIKQMSFYGRLQGTLNATALTAWICEDVCYVTPAPEPLSFSFCFSGLVIHNAPLTNVIVNVAFRCMLLSFLSISRSILSNRVTRCCFPDLILFPLVRLPLADTQLKIPYAT